MACSLVCLDMSACFKRPSIAAARIFHLAPPEPRINFSVKLSAYIRPSPVIGLNTETIATKWLVSRRPAPATDDIEDCPTNWNSAQHCRFQTIIPHLWKSKRFNYAYNLWMKAWHKWITPQVLEGKYYEHDGEMNEWAEYDLYLFAKGINSMGNIGRRFNGMRSLGSRSLN